MFVQRDWIACDKASVIASNEQKDSHFSVLKNFSGEFLGVSANFSFIAGYANPIDMLGTTDFELRCPSVALAEFFFTHDQMVWRHQLSQHLTVQISSFSQIAPHVLITERRFIPQGILGNCWFIKQCILSDYLQFFLTKLDRKFHHQLHRNYTIITAYDGLSIRESEVLFFLMEGLTAREISMFLMRSKRTVEHHIERMKEKMACHTKDQMASLGRFLQYHQSIPKRLVMSGTMHEVDLEEAS